VTGVTGEVTLAVTPSHFEAGYRPPPAPNHTRGPTKPAVTASLVFLPPAGPSPGGICCRLNLPKRLRSKCCQYFDGCECEDWALSDVVVPGSLEYPRAMSLLPRVRPRPRTCTGVHPNSTISDERRLQVPAPRLREGTSSRSSNCCVVTLSSLSEKSILPFTRCNFNFHGSVAPCCASRAVSSSSRSIHDFGLVSSIGHPLEKTARPGFYTWRRASFNASEQSSRPNPRCVD
jgi:hypothetical protein